MNTRADNKKALQLASVASMIDQFTVPNIEMMKQLGYSVDVIADFTNPGNITAERCAELKRRLHDMDVDIYDIAIPRSLNLKSVISAYRKVKNLIKCKHYNIIHCHSPIGGVICRLAAKCERKRGTKVIYTAHGFHFYDGAPLKNWLIYYPIEWWFSRYTDVLITINKEDYKRANERLKATKTVYIPGVGVNIDKFVPRTNGRGKIRAELGLNDSQIMLLSVGELNENKTHVSVIKAIKDIHNITYVIVGKGVKAMELEQLASDDNVDLRLMGYREDVADFYDAADVYVLPSIREGLNVSLMEAMASGLPVTCGRIRGNKDLIEDESMLFDPLNTEEIKSSIMMAIHNGDSLGQQNLKKIRNYDLSTVQDITSKIYRRI